MRNFSLYHLFAALAGGLLLAACAAGSADLVENGQCAVPYHPLRWKAIYCMAKQGTDDIEAAQSCIHSQESSLTFPSVCDENLYWKRKWCAVLSDAFPEIESCVKNLDNTPSGVVHGF